MRILLMIMFQRNTISCKVVIVFFNVLMCTCFAVIVTVDDIVSVAEGNETRIMCNMTRSSSSSVAVPIVTWYNVTNGVTDQIAQSQGGVGSVRSSYIDRFSVEGDTTLVIANTSRSDSGTYQCIVNIFDDPLHLHLMTPY
ncbi:uncharacterized protein LOC117125259 [Anneissia japonica]|uniref:uncharacterized protein LOC117125259 n=1 Tax=Anneissia japonica TaxID=1529436 RepID=UPI0014254D65|nr:uncharacterized protein LOC117125259 [Anneissia japonica]